MRPSTPEQKKRFKRRALIIGAIIVIMLVGYVLLTNYESLRKEEHDDLYISKAKLEPKKISPGENTQLEVYPDNPTDTTYDDIEIQVATKCSKIEISYLPDNMSATEENGEYRLTKSVATLGGGEEIIKSYVFDLSGELFPGLTSMTGEINVRILAENEEKDEETFTLTIENES